MIEFVNHRKGRPALTLIETCLAIVIIGVGITAAVNLLGTLTKQNVFAAKQTVAILLANNIQELLATIQYQDPRFIGVSPPHWGPLASGETFGPGNPNLGLEYFDGAVWGLDATTPGTAIDAGWNPIPATAANGGLIPINRYSQKVTVTKVSKTDLQTALADTVTDQGVRRVVIQVWCQPTATATDELIYQTAFLRFADR